MRHGRLIHLTPYLGRELLLVFLIITLHVLSVFASKRYPRVSNYASTLRNYAMVASSVLLPETMCRVLHGRRKRKNGKEYAYVLVVELREEGIKKLVRDVDRGRKLPDSLKDGIRRLAESSLSMLGILIAATIGLIAVALSKAPSGKLQLGIFVGSSAVTLLLLCTNLALCYSVLAPNIDDKVIVESVRKYYYFLLYGLSFLAITFVWGVYTYTGIFSIGFSLEGIGIPVLTLVAVSLLYRLAYFFKIPTEDRGTKV